MLVQRFLAIALFLVTPSVFAAPAAENAEIESILNETHSSLSDSIHETASLPETAPGVYVPQYLYKSLMTQVSTWKKEGFSYCMKNVKKFQCENSEFKDLAFLQRYEKLMSMVDARLSNAETAKGLEDHRNGISCIVARETGVIEPITISSFNCVEGGVGTDLGLGQVTMQTFLAVLGLNNDEISATVNDYFGRGGLKKRKRILTIARANSLPTVTQVNPFNTLEYRKNPMRMYEEMADSPEFQVDMMLAVLKMKKTVTQNDKYLDQLRSQIQAAKTPKDRAWLEKRLKGSIAYYQQKTYVNYNGSDAKEAYGAAVYACKSCLDGGKKDTAHCLGLAMGTKTLKDFDVCTK